MASMEATIEGKSAERGATSVPAVEVERKHRAATVWVVLLWLIVMAPLLWGIIMTLLDVQNLFRR
jgi:hypothetical protein